MDMECEECGQQPATSQVEWEVNGQVEEHFYCDECYAQINPEETFGKKSKYYSEIRKADDEEEGEEFYNSGLDASGIPYEYSSEKNACGMPQFLLEQLGKLETILAVEIFGPQIIEKTNKQTKKIVQKKDIPMIYCSGCGISQEEITTNQKAGCAKCYQVFNGVLMQKHRRFSDGKNYCGKTYEPKIIWSDIDYLQNELSVAVKDQNFERAARLRDEMNKLRKKASVE